MTWLEKRNITRNALLKAVRALVAERRHDHISIQEITTSASIATGTFYNYFDSKHDVFVAAEPRLATVIEEGVIAACSSLLCCTRASSCFSRMAVAIAIRFCCRVQQFGRFP